MLTRRTALIGSTALPFAASTLTPASAQSGSTLRIAMTLADIPVTRQEITDETLRARMTFEPTDHIELADRIVDAIDARAEFAEFQRSLVSSIYAGRSWSDVGSRYWSTISGIGRDKNER